MTANQARYRQLFIDEGRECIRQLHAALQRTKTTPGREPWDEAFRQAHTLKGMAASLQLNAFAALAHRLEDVADRGRSDGSLPAEAVALLVRATDQLDQDIDALEGGAPPPDDHLIGQQLAQWLSTSSSSSTSPAAVDTPVVIMTGEHQLKVRFAAGTALKVRAFVLLRELTALPGFVRSEPTADGLRQGDLPSGVLSVLFGDAASLQQGQRVASAATGVEQADVVVPVATTTPTPTEGTRNDDEPDRTVRVRSSLLDGLLEQVGEMLLVRSRLKSRAERHADPGFVELADEVDRLTRGLHSSIVLLRMTPLSFLLERLPRVVRELSHDAGKSVELTIEGGDIELDRAILDELHAPLLHLLRNAVDHAHDGDDARRAAGKSAAMRLTISAERVRDRVEIHLRDDGRGIDAAAVVGKAIAQGYIDSATAAAMTTAAQLEMICLPGLSTAAQVSQTSGRGVGMDVVKATVDKLGGRLLLRSAPGQGTTFTLRLPMTVAIVRVLVLDLGSDDAFALPVARIEGVLSLDGGRLRNSGGRSFLALDDGLVPLTSLRTSLGFVTTRPDALAFTVGSGNQRAAFSVPGVLGQEDVLIRPLHGPLAAVPYVSGGAILADGRAAFLLDVERM
jgi:two-component system, chemotaxis family, sensor kinase CheA